MMSTNPQKVPGPIQLAGWGDPEFTFRGTYRTAAGPQSEQMHKSAIQLFSGL